jgi:hypothetical protein
MTRSPGHTGQTAMHPTISYYLAQRDAPTRLARRADKQAEEAEEAV